MRDFLEGLLIAMLVAVDIVILAYCFASFIFVMHGHF